jgi:hypothetical protein
LVASISIDLHRRHASGAQAPGARRVHSGSAAILAANPGGMSHGQVLSGVTIPASATTGFLDGFNPAPSAC